MTVRKFNSKMMLAYTRFKMGWLTHLARHVPHNTRVNYAVGPSPTGSITT